MMRFLPRFNPYTHAWPGGPKWDDMAATNKQPDPAPQGAADLAAAQAAAEQSRHEHLLLLRR
jgi:hypothetical protein